MAVFRAVDHLEVEKQEEGCYHHCWRLDLVVVLDRCLVDVLEVQHSVVLTEVEKVDQCWKVFPEPELRLQKIADFVFVVVLTAQH